jgi:hypothetical protein
LNLRVGNADHFDLDRSAPRFVCVNDGEVAGRSLCHPAIRRTVDVEPGDARQHAARPIFQPLEELSDGPPPI